MAVVVMSQRLLCGARDAARRQCATATAQLTACSAAGGCGGATAMSGGCAVVMATACTACTGTTCIGRAGNAHHSTPSAQLFAVAALRPVPTQHHTATATACAVSVTQHMAVR